MLIENIIAKLEEISENPEGKVAIYFTRKDSKGSYTSYKPGISITLQKDFINISSEALYEVRNNELVPFNPSGSVDDTIEFYKYEEVDSLAHIIESLNDEKLLDDAPDDISTFTFYVLVVKFDTNDILYLFRRLTKFKKLEKGFMGSIVTGDFKKIDTKLLGIDNKIDIIGYNSQLIILYHISMERIFDIKAQYQESAKQTLDMIEKTNRIENFDQFKEDSINNGRVIRGLTKLLKDPERVKESLENIEKVKELVELVGLDIKFTKDDKLLYESKDQLQSITLIIRDAYYQSFISERLGVDELA